MQNNCLIIKASTAACAEEIEAIQANLKATDSSLTTKVVEWLSSPDFELQCNGEKFKIIYLGAHADGSGFGENIPVGSYSRFDWHEWEELAAAICISDCIIPGGILFMGCCRGGMKTVALKIFKACNKIDYIVGTRQNTRGGDLVAAFSTFVRNVKKGIDPITAAERASEGTGEKFVCHDRQELEVEISLAGQLDKLLYEVELVKTLLTDPEITTNGLRLQAIHETLAQLLTRLSPGRYRPRPHHK